jgi:chorismate mutase
MPNVGQIQDHRNHIDAIDERILRWVNQRIQVGLEIGKIKVDAGLNVLDDQREREILRRLRTINSGPLSEEAILRIFQAIIDETRQAQADSDSESTLAVNKSPAT